MLMTMREAQVRAMGVKRRVARVHLRQLMLLASRAENIRGRTNIVNSQQRTLVLLMCRRRPDSGAN